MTPFFSSLSVALIGFSLYLTARSLLKFKHKYVLDTMGAGGAEDPELKRKFLSQLLIAHSALLATLVGGAAIALVVWLYSAVQIGFGVSDWREVATMIGSMGQGGLLVFVYRLWLRINKQIKALL